MVHGLNVWDTYFIWYKHMWGELERWCLRTTSTVSPKFYDGPIEDEDINPKDIVNLYEEDFISKLYEKVMKGDEI